ncbi:HAD hydrolase family protein [Clostridium sp. HCP1S3_B4]|uniref:HAD hydrolase family protein n=1 Tax=Clostridium sp. HCP1S3_B4 TaxID=3438918 RepID=UPI003F8CB458
MYCTGRAISELQQYFKILPMVRYAVCYSGAIIYDCIENKYIYQNESNETGTRYGRRRKTSCFHPKNQYLFSLTRRSK